MAIPKIIYQTFVTRKLPLMTRFFIWWMQKVNPDYRYEFYDDTRIEQFLASEFPARVLNAYQRLAIGAAKGDFFRYAVLLRYGGVYLDIDGGIVRSLRHVIRPDDEAVLTRESATDFFVQWAMVFNKEHPFLKLTLDKVIDNIESNRYPYDVHKTTGPSVFTEAVHECLRENPSIPYRIFGIDYERKKKAVIIPKHFLNRIIYFQHLHWKKEQRTRPVLKGV